MQISQIGHRTKREGHTNFTDTIIERERDTKISLTSSQIEKETHKFHIHHHRTREGHTNFTDTITERERDTQNSQVPPHEKRGAHSVLHRYYHIKGEGCTKLTANTSWKEGHTHCNSQTPLHEGRGTHTTQSYRLLHLESHLITISNFNFLGLFSTEHGKRDLEN